MISVSRPQCLRAIDRRSLLYILALGCILIAVYFPAAILQGVFYVGDIFRLAYPARYEYAQALQRGYVPLWTSRALAGFPTLAEGQTGAYYPLNLLLYRLLPLPAAINYSILLSFWFAGAGAFVYGRSLGLRRSPAFLAGCVFMLGGFLPGHLNHLNMLAAVCWLPWLLWTVERAARPGAGAWWLLGGALFGLQGLAGHPQISLLSALLLVLYALVGPLWGGVGSVDLRRRAERLSACAGMLVLGGVLAAVQWLPTFELTRLSARGQGLDATFFTSFSLHPAHFVTMLWPFVQGNPYPLTSLEVIGYVGVLPLLLAGVALARCRNRAVGFWAFAAAVALLMSLGRWNPAYRLLAHVPVLNMFRAPARYLLWLDLAIAVLAAIGMDSLLGTMKVEESRAKRLAWVGVAVGALATAGYWFAHVPLESLVVMWRWLPLVWLAGAATLLLCSANRFPRTLWVSLLVMWTLADLWAFQAVYNETYNDVMAPEDLTRAPASALFLKQDAGGEPFRVLTSEEIVPVLPVMRESLYPNIQLLQGIDSLNGYYPLVPGSQQWLFENLDARLLDLLNVRYVLIPQVLPVDETTEAYDTTDPYAPPIVGRSFDIAATLTAGLEVEGYLSHSADLPDGEPVCEVAVRGVDGKEAVWTLKAGQDLAEWAYERDDVLEIVKHGKPKDVARRWPAESGFPARAHDGLTFCASTLLPETMQVEHIEVRPLIPAAYVRLERLYLIAPDGSLKGLSEFTGEGDHVLVYRSSDVAIYRNERVGPRAFLVHQALYAQTEEEARRVLASPDFDPHKQVVILGEEQTALNGDLPAEDRIAIESYFPEYVRVRSASPSPSYLVLADSFYPGWKVYVDGEPAPLLRADVALRAVTLPAGEHVVEFRFSPTSWRIGTVISAIAWGALAVALTLLVARRVSTNSRSCWT